MDLCFLYRKIITDINFYFLYKNKKNSICFFYLKLSNNTIVKIIAYDELADFCYKNLEINNLIFFKGFLNSNNEVMINNIKI